MPRGAGPFPVVVMIHGGSWQPRFSKVVMRPLCRDLVRRGWAAWNIEYRRVGGGQGGGWPATFDDVEAAITYLAEVDAPIDLSRVVLLGHSAGGQLALWAASQLDSGAPVRPGAVIALAAVANLEFRESLTQPGGIVNALMGGAPRDLPERYAAANPLRNVPLSIPALLIHGTNDTTVSVGHSRQYAEAAGELGGEVDLVELEAGHRDHIDPRSAAWACVTERLDKLAASRVIGVRGP